MVKAMKITGDLNVPRGVLTWKFRLDDRVGPGELPHEPAQARRVFGPLEQIRIYRGTGTISGTGYMYVLSNHLTPLARSDNPPSEEHRSESTDFVAIVSRDEIRVNWFDMDEDYAPSYCRYRGRDLNSEVIHGQLRTPTIDFQTDTSTA